MINYAAHEVLNVVVDGVDETEAHIKMGFIDAECQKCYYNTSDDHYCYPCNSRSSDASCVRRFDIDLGASS